ncbi:hypothetical protein LY78DRAFT_657536 [Colletotrichum sublineola]|nr:hypothetical protein LY78DRAFT_657536 [Colletotrichum sublineola]
MDIKLIGLVSYYLGYILEAIACMRRRKIWLAVLEREPQTAVELPKLSDLSWPPYNSPFAHTILLHPRR